MEKTIKKQKISIIILSIILGIFAISFFTTIIINNIEKQTYTISITDYYKNPETQTSLCYVVEITCKEEKTIAVSDFTYKQGENIYQYPLRIIVNDKTYTNEESFVIKPYTENKIKIYTSLLNKEPDTLLFKGKQIKFGISVDFR